MANTNAVYARIDNELKENAECILQRLGISPSSAIQMLYSQIVLQNGMPFVSRIPESSPAAIGIMTKEELDSEILRGVNSAKFDKVYSADDVDEELLKEFNI